MNGWYLLLWVVGIVSILTGFAWRMGYEFSRFRHLISKARYLSIYGYQISIDKAFLRIGWSIGTRAFSLSSSYPSIVSILPLVVVFSDLSLSVTDDSDDILIHDYSEYRFEVPNFQGWPLTVTQFIASIFRPCLRFTLVEYSYKTPSFGPMNMKLAQCHCDVLNKRFVSEVGMEVQFVVEKDSVYVKTDRLDCRFNPSCLEAEVTCENFEVKYSLIESVEKLISRFSNPLDEIAPTILSPVKFRLVSRIQSRIKFVALSIDSKSLVETIVSMNSSKTSKIRGIYTNIEFDPFSSSFISFSVHNFNDVSTHKTLSTVSVSTTLIVHNVPLVHLVGTNVNAIFDSSWNCSVRLTSLQIALLSTDPVVHRLVNLKQVALVGNSAKGLSVSVSGIEIDASPRMINRLVRVYTKLISNFFNVKETPTLSLITPITVTDLNYMRMQKKFSSTTPPTPIMSIPQFHRSESASTGLNESTMSHSRDVKNWRYKERISSTADLESEHVNSRMVLSVVASSIRIDTGNELLVAEMNTVKLIMKTSSIGTNFTSFNCDSISINDNIKSDGGGFRVWIDGDLLSDQSRVFCLVPPVSIRFDPKFAGIVERYFLDVAEALKGMSKSSPTTAKKMIEVLQVSSLQLELHAREMLGVLSLDKAVINLNKTSVYKSNGFLDAVNSLATQYRADVTSQWLSLLMRLDVSIGRPMSTARKLIGSISGLFVNGNEDGNEK